MALNFPNSPTLNQIYTDSTSGFSYQWNGTVWISYSASTTNNISELDDISGSFNSVATIFPLTVGGQSVSPASTNQLLISVGGVMQNPTNDFYISGSNIVFTTAPTNGLTFFGTLLGTSVPIGVSTIGDVYNRQVYSVAGVQTSFSFTSGYTVGYLDVFRNGVRLIAGNDFTATTGNSFSLSPPAQNTDDVEAIGYKVSTIAVTEGNLINLIVNQNATVLGITTLGAGVGAGQTALLVQGNARVTGILTVGSSSITLNGTTNVINVGTGVTINGTTGTISASSFVGSGSGLTGVGIGTDGNVNTTGNINAGIITATRLDVPATAGIFSPSIGATNVSVDSNIIITFNQAVQKRSGNITLRANSAGGTAFSTIAVGDDAVTISGAVVTIDPPSNIGAGVTTFVVIDAGAFSGLSTSLLSVLIDTYSFTTQLFALNLFVWGQNVYGELGQNNTTNRSSPIQIPGTTWSSIDINNHTLAKKSNNTLWSWGNNSSGQLGQSNNTQFSSPVQIPGTSWSSINGGTSFSLATKTDNTLWSWGYNTYGTLGNNQSGSTHASSPIQIPGTTWSSVAAGGIVTLATKTDGTLWSWGYNYYGNLGQNNQINRSSPVQIPGNTWSKIAVGFPGYHSLATKTDGTLWVWGREYYGNLGQNNRIHVSSPVQIPGTTWSNIAAGYHSLATKTDNTLWAWGYNGHGSLGQNNITYASSPVQIPGTTWSNIAAGYYSLATKTDNTLWAWGYNAAAGNLGLNNQIQRSSPVQIPGTTWSSISSGAYTGASIQANP